MIRRRSPSSRTSGRGAARSVPSLEYFVRGLELGNAVFTEFQGTLDNHTTLDNRIIDMGAGLERFAWITMGTPTAYDCCFGAGPGHDGGGAGGWTSTRTASSRTIPR